MVRKGYTIRTGSIFKRTPANIIEGKPSPFDTSSELATTIRQMERIANFNPFNAEKNKNSRWVDYIVHMPSSQKNHSIIKFLNESEYYSMELFLQKSHYAHTNDKADISSCCFDSRKSLRVIKATFDFIDTPNYANVIFINSKIPIKILSLNAYFKYFGTEEETLQRKLVEANMAFGQTKHAQPSMGFRIFPDRASAENTIDKEMFDYLKAAIANKSFESGFIIGHEDKYRWPLNLNIEDLQKGTKNPKIAAVGTTVPTILAVHSDGTTITYTGDSNRDVLPLSAYFNPEKGILGDLGLASKGSSNYHNHYVAACEHCEPYVVSKFKPRLLKYLNLKMVNSGFSMQGFVAREMGYQIDLYDLEIKVNNEKVILGGRE